MAVDHELAYQPLYRLRELIAAKELSPVELVETTLERIDHYNSRLGAFITVTHDLALEQARKAEAEVLAGEPLDFCTAFPCPSRTWRGSRGSASPTARCRPMRSLPATPFAWSG